MRKNGYSNKGKQKNLEISNLEERSKFDRYSAPINNDSNVPSIWQNKSNPFEELQNIPYTIKQKFFARQETELPEEKDQDFNKDFKNLESMTLEKLYRK